MSKLDYTESGKIKVNDEKLPQNFTKFSKMAKHSLRTCLFKTEQIFVSNIFIFPAQIYISVVLCNLQSKKQQYDKTMVTKSCMLHLLKTERA